jgi:hypothetical protein
VIQGIRCLGFGTICSHTKEAFLRGKVKSEKDFHINIFDRLYTRKIAFSYDDGRIGVQGLLPILQRIGDGSTSEQGLEELHRFTKEHPEVDTKPFMARLSKDFHAFVEKGLARLEKREKLSTF